MAKVAIVTGGARGIGRGCAHALARKGLDVALVDVLAPEMERTAGELRAMGRAVRIYEAEVALHARAAEVVRTVLDCRPAIHSTVKRIYFFCSS